MASCQHCHKGVQTGHAVSHAKNRTQRLFKPNLQKLKVLRDGFMIRVKLCTRCIKRLRKDGRVGLFFLFKAVSEAVKLPSSEKVRKKETFKPAEKEKARPTLDIASIVGKKE